METGKLGNWETDRLGNFLISQFPNFPLSAFPHRMDGYPLKTPVSVTTMNRSVRAS